MKSNANLSSVQGGGTSTSSNSSISGSVGVGGAYDTSRNSLDIKDKSIFSQLKSVLCLDTSFNVYSFNCFLGGEEGADLDDEDEEDEDDDEDGVDVVLEEDD